MKKTKPPVVRNAVREYLMAHKATKRQLIDATGRPEGSVREAVAFLRLTGDPCIQNLLPTPGQAKIQAEIEANRPDRPLPSLSAQDTIKAALGSRHPLETAWN